MFSPFRIFFPVLWPLLTSCRSLLLRIFFCVGKTSPGTHTFFPSLPAAFTEKRFRVAIGLCFAMQTYPRLRPYMRFLFVRPELCPFGELSAPIPASFRFRLTTGTLALGNPSPLPGASGTYPLFNVRPRGELHDSASFPKKGRGAEKIKLIFQKIIRAPLQNLADGRQIGAVFESSTCGAADQQEPGIVQAV